MAWTAEIINKRFEQGKVFFRYRLTDGVQVIDEEASTTTAQTVEWVKNYAASRADEISRLEKFRDDIPLGLANPVVVTPPAISPAEVAASAYADKVRLFRAWQGAIEAGVKLAAGSVYLDLRNQLKTEFLPAYLRFFGRS